MSELSIDERLKQLEDIHANFQIVGGSNVTAEGSLRHGYAITSRCPEPAAVAGGIIPPPPPTPTGACCDEDGTCSITTQSVCEGSGGTYQGDDTTCDPNPCPQPATGACCVGTDCTIETEDDCTGMGGTYQGDDTTCDPNPCEMPPCNGCGFEAFDGSSRRFLTMTETFTRTAHSDIISGSDGCDYNHDLITVTTLSTVDCSESVSCSGTMHYENAAHPELEFATCNYVSDGSGGCHLVLEDSAGGLDCGIFGGCADGHCGGCAPSFVSATEMSCSCDFSDLHSSAHSEVSIILSDECTP